jgi:hypothetical protein
MANIHIITPVKNSLSTALQTIESVMNSTGCEFSYTVYDDFSDEPTRKALHNSSEEKGFNLVHLSDITDHPSPNYLLVLQLAQQRAIKENCPLVVIESDVIINQHTVSQLYKLNGSLHKPGLIAAVTTDDESNINFPYLYARSYSLMTKPTMKRLSFCCTLMNQEFLKMYDFRKLNPEKNWYDVFISRQSISVGFTNYLATDIQVIHKPHSSRPWKLEKYSNPLKYYWNKITKGRDKI